MKVGTIDQDLLQRIITENNLLEVAEEYGVIFGANNKAACPFHDDNSPSLHYHSKNDTYYCYCATCKAGTRWENKGAGTTHKLTLPDGVVIEDGGPTVVGFVMNMERCGYVDACVKLMERAGIPVPQGKVNMRLERMKQKVTSDNKLFCKTLLKDEDMLDYLESRSISTSSIKKWRIGVVPKNYHHDKFGSLVKGRLVFGITEQNFDPRKAKTVAMAYRDLKYEKGSNDHNIKYINDAESEIYHKSSILYGLNEARKAIREAGYALVMEGYIDVIISHESEVENAVAICGTSFTDEQMDLLQKLTKKIVFWLDGDPAGINAMRKALPRLLARGFRVMVLICDGRDPAEQMIFMRKNGKAIKRYIADRAIPARIFLAEEALKDYEIGVQKLKADVLDELLPVMGVITDETERILFKNMIEERIRVSI